MRQYAIGVSLLLIAAARSAFGLPFARLESPLQDASAPSTPLAQQLMPPARFSASGRCVWQGVSEKWAATFDVRPLRRGGWAITGSLDTPRFHLTRARLNGSTLELPEVALVVRLDSGTIEGAVGPSGSWSVEQVTSLDTQAAIQGGAGEVLVEPAQAASASALVIGASDCVNGPCGLGLRTSLDGGVTYPHRFRTTAGYSFASDPSVTVSPGGGAVPGGIFYAAAVGFNSRTDGKPEGSNAFFFVTSNDGTHWSSPGVVDASVEDAAGYTFRDRPWLAFGPDGRLWALWREFLCNSGGCFGGGEEISSSADGGGTWTTPIAASVSPPAILFIEQPHGNLVALPDGAVLVPYFALDEHIVPPPPQLDIFVSNIHIARCTPAVCTDIALIARKPITSTLNTFDGLPATRMNSSPFLARRSTDGMLLLVWMNLTPDFIGRVLASFSSDNGATWTTPAAVDANNTDEFFPFPAFGGSGSGAPFPEVCYYRRADEISSTVNVYCNFYSSTCNGWCVPTLVDGPIIVPLDHPESDFLGDYIAFDGYHVAFTNTGSAGQFISTNTYFVSVAPPSGGGCHIVEGGNYDPFFSISVLAALAAHRVRRRLRCGG